MVSSAFAKGDPLIAESAKVQTLAEGFKFGEGPARAPNGDLYFVDFRANKIHRWSIADQKLATITDDSHGVNGMQFDAKGRLLGCQGNKRRVVAMDASSGEVLEVMADNFGGKQFNNPNDLWIDPQGGIYFTDPAYSRNKSELELDGRYVFYARISFTGLWSSTPVKRRSSPWNLIDNRRWSMPRQCRMVAFKSFT